MYLRIFSLALVLGLAATALAPAAAKPVPGGANQVAAMSGKVGQMLWNGQVRLTITEVREASAADHPESILPLRNQKVMVMKGLVRNGLPRTFGESLDFTLADKDAVSFSIPGHFITPVSFTIQRGAAVKFSALFPVDKDYKPTKLIVACSTCGNGAANKFKSFRIAIASAP